MPPHAASVRLDIPTNPPTHCRPADCVPSSSWTTSRAASQLSLMPVRNNAGVSSRVFPEPHLRLSISSLVVPSVLHLGKHTASVSLADSTLTLHMGACVACPISLPQCDLSSISSTSPVLLSCAALSVPLPQHLSLARSPDSPALYFPTFYLLPLLFCPLSLPRTYFHLILIPSLFPYVQFSPLPSSLSLSP